jgi:hypothetical protein
MDNATFVFEIYLRDNAFMGQIDNFIRIFQNYAAVDLKNTPQLVLSIVELLHTRILNGEKMERFIKTQVQVKQVQVKHVEFNLTLDDTHLLLDLYRKYIIEQLVLCDETVINEFTGIYNVCVNLAVTQLKMYKPKKKYFWQI